MMLGWCSSGHHDECIREYRRFYIGPVGKGRKKKDGVVWLDEWVKCGCKNKKCICYKNNQSDEKPVKKRPTRRKK